MERVKTEGNIGYTVGIVNPKSEDCVLIYMHDIQNCMKCKEF